VTHPDVLVLGGGIIGLACARELATAGFQVEICERLRAGAEASTAAAGMLTPLAESPVAGPFFDACRAARDLWAPWVPALAEESGLGVEYDTSGALLVALAATEAAWLERIDRTARALGEAVEEIEPAVLYRRVPDLAPGVRRALHLPGEHRVDNVQACAALAVAARRRGVELRYASAVERVERRGDGVRVHGNGWRRDAGLLVLAAGAWSGLVPGLPELPVRPVRGQMLLLGGVDWPWQGIVRGEHAYTVRRGATGLLVGATSEEAGFVQHATVAGIEGLLAFARRLFPGLDGAHLEATWAGLRPGTPDDLPIVGWLPGWPVLAATGHYRNGILLAPWTARRVAELAQAGPGSGEGDPFSPARFGVRGDTSSV
jgi:glycine oxidase